MLARSLFPSNDSRRKEPVATSRSRSGTSCKWELAEAGAPFIMQLSIIRCSLLLYQGGAGTHLCRAVVGGGDRQTSGTEPSLLSRNVTGRLGRPNLRGGRGVRPCHTQTDAVTRANYGNDADVLILAFRFCLG